MSKAAKKELDENLIFVGTIYDSFEALEETLGKLKLERPLFLTHIAKMAFAEEVFKHVDGVPNLCRFTSAPSKQTKQFQQNIYN